MDKNLTKNHLPPYKCKLCGLGDIKKIHDICELCGWEDDAVQNDNPNYIGGANIMSLNQYRKFWLLNKDEILKNIKVDPFIAIKKAKEYYEKFIKR